MRAETRRKAGATGCCYSIGYGAMMAPCCLSTSQTAEDGCTNPDGWVGGGKAWNATCPTSASEANMWLQACWARMPWSSRHSFCNASA
mmetsp:Transcript_84196/g.131443  ORF Transcript_84196/g.131443 Transcript_84196/m.131443 type:complete len:88 (-) Transcript_84196:113-376(-)